MESDRERISVTDALRVPSLKMLHFKYQIQQWNTSVVTWKRPRGDKTPDWSVSTAQWNTYVCHALQSWSLGYTHITTTTTFMNIFPPDLKSHPNVEADLDDEQTLVPPWVITNQLSLDEQTTFKFKMFHTKTKICKRSSQQFSTPKVSTFSLGPKVSHKKCRNGILRWSSQSANLNPMETTKEKTERTERPTNKQ